MSAGMVLGYIAGVLTYPAIIAVVALGFRIDRWLTDHGWWIKVRVRVTRMEPYELDDSRRTITQRGPFYRGTWKRYDDSVSRWIGVGYWRGPGISLGRITSSGATASEA